MFVKFIWRIYVAKMLYFEILALKNLSYWEMLA